MLKKCTYLVLILVLLVALIPTPALGANNAASLAPNITEYIKDWKIMPSDGLTTSMGTVGVTDAVALAGSTSTGAWFDAKVPGSVLGNLVDDGYYNSLFNGKDVFYDDNLYKIPVADFAKAWWYRTEFELPADQIGKKVLLTFEGINYAADVYVNGVEMKNQHTNVTEEMLLNHNSDGSLGPGNGALATSGTGANSINYAVSANPSAGAQQLHTMKRGELQPGSKYNDSDYNTYSKQFIGGYRTYELDVTDLAVAGKNMICVKVQAPYYIRDLSWMWIDWITAPPDNNMGLTGNVILSTSNEVRLSNPFVSSKVSYDLDNADLKLYVDLSEMGSAGDVTGDLSATINKPDGSLYAKITKKNIVVKSGAYLQETALTCDEFPELSVSNPELWWPYLSGEQPLYTVEFDFTIGGIVSHTVSQRFGIREVGAEINVSPYSLGTSTALTTGTSGVGLRSQMIQIYFNHRPVLLKGGGATPTDLLWRSDDVRNKAAIDYARYMGLNMLRDEGKFDHNLIDYCDEQGIVMMSGWACCDRWQEPGRLNKGERLIAYESLFSQIRYFRQHAAFANMANGSDQPPGYSSNGANGAAVEYGYFQVEAATRLFEHASIVSSGAAYGTTNVINGVASVRPGVAGGMHMDEAYNYMQPKFFFEDPAGSYGFVSEGGGCPSVPVIETIKKILPNDQLWPYNIGETDGKTNNANWQLHAARGNFRTYDWFNRALDSRYGASETLDKYIMKASVAAYEMQRAHFESFNLHRYTDTTGLVAWMYNNAWPMMFWNLYDNLMNPNGSTYGARMGNEPVHIMYDPYKKEVSVINNTQNVYPGAKAEVTLYDIYGNVIGGTFEKLDINKDSASPTVDFTLANGTVVTRKDIKVGLELDDSGQVVDKNYKAYGQILKADGVTKLWDATDLNDCLSGPLTEVYFLRLELKDGSDSLLSANSYPLSLRDDIIKYSSRTYQYTPSYDYCDYALLNSMPHVNLNVSVTSSAIGDKITETVTLKNDKVQNKGVIAYAVELKARVDDKNLVAPVFYSDNFFTLYPDETRIITITYDKSTYNGYAPVEYTCYNNICSPGAPVRETTIRSTGNLALRKPVVVSSLYNTTATYQASNATDGIANNATDNIVNDTVNSNNTTVWSHASSDANPWLYTDLGSVQNIDRVKTNWSYVYRPEKLVIDISDDALTWKEAAVCDNPSGSSLIEYTFPATIKARYIRVSPSGKRGAIRARGVTSNVLGATSWNGTLASNVAGTFELSAIEVYRFTPGVFLDIKGSGIVSVGSKEYNSAMDVEERLIPLESGSDLTLKFKSVSPWESVSIFRDGLDVTNNLNANNEITLSNITKDTVISFNNPAILVSKSRSDYSVSAFVKDKDASLIIAGYGADGKLKCIARDTSNIAAPEWRYLTADAESIYTNGDVRIVKGFLWDGVTFTPLTNDLVIR